MQVQQNEESAWSSSDSHPSDKDKTSDGWGTVSFPVGGQCRWGTEKKLRRRFDKTKGQRKGPCLKARVIAFFFRGLEGPCSLRKYKTGAVCFVPCGSTTPVVSIADRFSSTTNS